MPDTKLPTEPETPSSAPSKGLKDKAPPKPPRRKSLIPPALAVSGTASRIPPARRPPKPTESSHRPPALPQAWASDGAEGDRPTAHPVALATTRPAPERGGLSALLGVSVTALLLGGWWFLREPPATAQTSSRTTAAHADQGAHREPVPKAAPAPVTARGVRSIDLDASPRPPPTDMRALHEPSSTEARSAKQAAASPANLDATQPPPTPEAAATTAASVAEPEASPLVNGSSPAAGASVEAANPPPAALPAFDASAARSALGASALAASSCRKGDDPRGTAEVIVTFAPSGRVTSANVNGAPYGGTATGGCVAATLRGAMVPPFSGNHVTVRKLVTVR